MTGDAAQGPDGVRTLGPPAPGVRTEVLGTRSAVFAPAVDEVLFLNESATQVWSLCDGSRTEADVVQELAAGYGVPVSEIAPDVAAVVARLVRARLFATPAST